MNSDRLITVAIHTYEKALALKGTLEREGIIAVLNNVNLTQPTISSGVRVRIAEKDLPLALRIIENPDIFNRDSHSFESLPTIIVPTDFSDYSYRACLMAFDIARLYKANIIILHSYLRADAIEKLNSYDTDSESFYSEFDDELEVANKMSEFSHKIVEQIKFGLIPPIKFSTKIVEGVPEDAGLHPHHPQGLHQHHSSCFQDQHRGRHHRRSACHGRQLPQKNRQQAGGLRRRRGCLVPEVNK